MSKITPCLWFNGQAEEAAHYYVGLFPDSAIGAISRYGEGAPFPAGTALMVDFTLAGLSYQALNGGPQFKFSPAVSLSIECADQAEVDYYWDHLVEGGQPSMCGWLDDRFGVSWQVVPVTIARMQTSGDKAGIERMWAALMKMRRLDVAALERAFRGD